MLMKVKPSNVLKHKKMLALYEKRFLVSEDVVCFCPAIDFVNTDFKS